MKIKKFLLIMFIAVILTACGRSPIEAPEEITVALSTITLADRFFVRLNDGMEKRANETGVSLILHNPDGEPTSQYSAVENFITQGADVIIVDPMEPNGIMPALVYIK